MKIRFKYIFFVCLTATLITGCSKEDVLELTPEFQLDAINNPSTLQQVEQVLLGTYARFRAGDYYGSASGTGAGWALMPDVLSDNIWETQESLANSRAMADWIYDASTAQINNIYVAPTNVIASANIVLRDVDKFATATNQTTINRIKGQALAIRALAHFDLFRYFAVNYDRNSTTVLAIPYSKEFVVSTSFKPARLNNKEFYDNLFADITEAISLLSNVDKPINPGGLTRPFIDLNGAYALQARAYLYAEQWSEAATAATNAINNRPLAGGNSFIGMYNQTNLGEIIWNVQFESGQGGPTFIMFFPAQNRAYFRPAFEVVNQDNTGLIKTDDVRYAAYFEVVNGLLAITKYKGKGIVRDGNANFIVFRTGEMYLIRAEARARMGQDANALDDLNALRAARIQGYTPVSGLTNAQILQEIADERRRELIGEGHRFFDLKRTTRTIVRGSTCGDITLSPTGNCTLSSSAREWAFPIPEIRRNANENLTQNPGY